LIKLKNTFWSKFSELTNSATFHSAAFLPSKPYPVRMNLNAFFYPISLASLWVPPIPGISPKLISGSAKYAFSLHTIISQYNANSHPPPKAFPFTAAMTGFLFPVKPASRIWKIYFFT
jgi:hypothetical protein